jgi:hypothetical protein
LRCLPTGYADYPLVARSQILIKLAKLQRNQG